MDTNVPMCITLADGAKLTGEAIHMDADIVLLDTETGWMPLVVPVREIREILYCTGSYQQEWYGHARSARQWQKSYNGAKAASRAGGTVNPMRAIYGKDDDSSVPEILCKALDVDEWNKLHTLRHYDGPTYRVDPVRKADKQNTSSTLRVECQCGNHNAIVRKVDSDGLHAYCPEAEITFQYDVSDVID